MNSSLTKQIYVQNDINNALLSLSNYLSDINTNIKNNSLTINERGVTIHTRLQTIFNLKFKSQIERQIFNIIVSHAIEAEKKGPGAFDVTIGMVLDKLRKYLKGNKHSFNLNKRDVFSRHPNSQDINSLIDNQVRNVDTTAADMLKEALNLAGFGGKIVIEKTHASMPSVELSRGYTFDVKPGWDLTTKFENPRAFVIDGYVESVSEIHHLLETANQTKDQVLLFLRGLSDDVLNTLRVNYDRSTLRVVPISVKFDLEGINTINDISIVCGCNLISSNKGDLISSIKFDKSPRLNSALIYPNKIVIQNESTHEAVASQISMLKTKRSEVSSVEDVGTLYNKRIRSLSPNYVVIRIPDDKDFVRISQSIDYALRTIKSYVDHGISDSNMPTAAVIAAEVHTNKCLETLISIGSIVMN